MMVKIIKKIVLCLAFIIITTAGVNYLGYLVRPIDTDVAYYQIKSFHSLPKNSLDVIIYGSSRAFKGFDSVELYDRYGISGYNYSCNWQCANTTRLFIADSLLTQCPKVAVIETDCLSSIEMDYQLSAQIYYTRYLNNKWDIPRYLNGCFGKYAKGYISYVIPIYAFHDGWKELQKANFRRSESQSNRMREARGSFGENVDIKEIEVPKEGMVEQLELNSLVVKEMDEIVAMLKSKGTEIIFYTAPFASEFEYRDAIRHYAEKNDCSYIDMFEHMESAGIDPNTDFYDESHLNVDGAKKMADYIGAYIEKNYY